MFWFLCLDELDNSVDRQKERSIECSQDGCCERGSQFDANFHRILRSAFNILPTKGLLGRQTCCNHRALGPRTLAIIQM